jgi:hypothetical protein
LCGESADSAAVATFAYLYLEEHYVPTPFGCQETTREVLLFGWIWPLWFIFRYYRAAWCITWVLDPLSLGDMLTMDSQAFTLFHVAISLVAIGSGFLVIYGLFTSKRMPSITALFLATTALTSITGYFFHREHLLPSHIVGAIALVVLAVTALALYSFHQRGAWRAVYVVGAVVSLYFNVFVLVAQAFLKIPSLHALAPNGSEPPFAIAQGLVLLVFVVIGFMATRRFRPL